METRRANLFLGRWSLCLLLLGLVVLAASAPTLSDKDACLQAVDQFNKHSREAHLYRLLERNLTLEHAGNPKILKILQMPRPVNFTVKETLCPRTSQQSPEQCAFKKDGRVKHCEGTVPVDGVNREVNITCEEANTPSTTPYTETFTGLTSRTPISIAWGQSS